MFVTVKRREWLDRVTRLCTAATTFDELINLPPHYHPSIYPHASQRLGIRLKYIALAQAYDEAQAARNDPRRCYRGLDPHNQPTTAPQTPKKINKPIPQSNAHPSIKRLESAIAESERFLLRAEAAVKALRDAGGYHGPCRPLAAAKRAAIDAAHALHQVNKSPYQD